MRFAGPGSESRQLRWWTNAADEAWVAAGRFDCPARCVQALNRARPTSRLPRVAAPPLLP